MNDMTQANMQECEYYAKMLNFMSKTSSNCIHYSDSKNGDRLNFRAFHRLHVCVFKIMFSFVKRWRGTCECVRVVRIGVERGAAYSNKGDGNY